MPINFFSSIALDKQEIQQVSLEVLSTAPSAGADSYKGRIIFADDTDTLSYYDGTAWISLTGGGGVSTFTNTNGTFISAVTANVAATGAVSMGVIDLSASGTPNATTFLRGDNTWGTPAGGGSMSDWISAGDNAAAPTTVTDGATLTFTGGVGIVTVSATGSITTTLDLTELPANAVALAPASDLIVGVWNSGADQGTKVVNAIPISSWATATSTIDMGTNKILAVVDPTNPQEAATKAYVDSVVVGALVFQGGYNASTNSPDLDSATNIAITKGWAYVVTVAGDFFTEAVEIGDLIIANEDMTASGGSTLVKWTTVQNNIDLASNTVAGIASFPTGNGFATMTGGAAKIAAQTPVTAIGSATAVSVVTTNAFGAVTAATEIDIAIPTTQITDLGEAIDVGDGTNNVITFSHSLNTRNVAVTLYQKASPYETVYAQVARTSVSSITLTFSSIPTSNQYVALLTKIV